MAVLSTCPGLKVEIIVNGEPLQEFDGSEGDQAADTKTTYIEATTGAEFAVKYDIGRPISTNALRVQI